MMAPHIASPAMRRVRRIHMLGIGGSGMAGIAQRRAELINRPCRKVPQESVTSAEGQAK